MRSAAHQPPSVDDASPIAVLLAPLRHAGLLRRFAAREVAARHRGSVLGWAWALAQPLGLLALYTFAFGIVWQARWGVDVGGGALGFALAAFAGLIVYDFVASVWSACPGLMLAHGNLVKRVVFPVAILPAAVAGASGVFLGVNLGLLLVGTLIATGGVPTSVVAVPMVIALLLPWVVGVGWALAGVGAFVRDVRPIVTHAVLPAMLLLTPIFYPLERVPEGARWVLGLNPLAVAVEAVRGAALSGVWPSAGVLAMLGGGGLVVAWVGAWVFARCRPALADVV